MTRRFGLLLALLMLPIAFGAAPASPKAKDKPKDKPKEVVDLAEAQADPDFAFQGEYVGQFGDEKVAAQVIAMGKGQFKLVGYQGGLPGAGWSRGDRQVEGEGKRDGNKVVLSGEEVGGGEICGLTIAGTSKEGQKFTLKRIERKSATLGAAPPAGAVVLFDGSSAEKFDNPAHLTKEKTLESGVTTQDGFANYSLHLEFCLSWMPDARGQGRSNSGVYIHDCYEIQVLDSFGLKGADNECGGFYKLREPDVNMCLPPMTWQTYDIDFIAPKYEGDNKVANARITVRHNGVVIHKDIELPKFTPGRKQDGPAPRPIHLQGHGNRVQYRNIWLVEKKM
jgi:hypothetical protein